MEWNVRKWNINGTGMKSKELNVGDKVKIVGPAGRDWVCK
jgi:hypothetical protein